MQCCLTLNVTLLAFLRVVKLRTVVTSVSFTLFHNVSINVFFYNCIQREPLNMMLISILIVMETRPQKS